LLASVAICGNLTASIFAPFMSTEADARIIVDRLLREAGWDIEKKAQVSTEEAAADGRADYLLKNQRTQPIAVVEAKRFSVDPYSAKQQAKDYAVSMGAPFVVLSNGREHYFWEYDTGDARPVVGLPSPADRVEGDGSSLRKARKFGSQYRDDFPDLLAKWPKREIADGMAWRVPAQQIIDNGYNLTLTSLGLVEPDEADHAEPEDILASVAEKERRILKLVKEMRELVTANAE
jgi:hypothetical protein